MSDHSPGGSGAPAAATVTRGCPVRDFFRHLLDTSDFAPRWPPGDWSAGLRWLRVLSDLGVWSAFFAVPVVLGVVVLGRREVRLRPVRLLVCVFAVVCGSAYLTEAVTYWWPAYRLAVVIKLLAVAVAWATVAALVRLALRAPVARYPEELAREAASRKQAEGEPQRPVSDEARELARSEATRRGQEREIRRLNEEMREQADAHGADLRLSEDQLRAKVAELQAVLDVVPMGVGIAHDPGCRRITHNPYTSERLGVAAWDNGSLSAPPGERPAYAVYQGGRRLAPEELPMQVACTGVEVRDCEVVVVAPGRPPVPLVCYATPLRDGLGNIRGSVGAVLDVSERKRSDERLRESERRLRLALSAARMVAWEYDADADRVTATDNLAEVYGVPPGTALEQFDQGLRLVHPDDRERHRAAVTKAIAERGGYVSEFRIVRPDNGEVVWLEERGQALPGEPGAGVRLAGVVMDVSARWRALEERARLVAELEAKNALIEAVVGQLPVGVIAAEAGTGRLLLGNREAERISGFGYEAGVPVRENDVRSAMRGYRPDGRVYGPDDWPLSRALRGETVQREEIELLREDASRLTISANAGPVVDRAGAVVAAVVAFHDVTGWKRAEEALKEADRRKDDFLAMLGHELRNPLAPVRNALGVLRLQSAAEPTVARMLPLLERQVATLTRLVDDLLDVSRISRGKVDLRKETVDLAALAARVAESTRPALEEQRHHFDAEVPAGPVWAEADPARVEQVLMNLLGNAGRYTPPGGHVRLSLAREGGEAAFRVRDTGIGIPPEDVDAVWQTFQQAGRVEGRAPEGLGLGLTVVRRLVELHGGTVEVASDGRGKGSEFTVRLPALPEGAEPPQRAEVPKTEPVAAGGLRVLVVDDNRDAAESLALVLQLAGHETRTAGDGPQALVAAREFRPAAVLLDIGLPGPMDGYKVALRLREEPGLEAVLLVAVTGYGTPEDVARAREARFDRHITKPADPEQVRRLLAESQTGGAAG